MQGGLSQFHAFLPPRFAMHGPGLSVLAGDEGLDLFSTGDLLRVSGSGGSIISATPVQAYGTHHAIHAPEVSNHAKETRSNPIPPSFFRPVPIEKPLHIGDISALPEPLPGTITHEFVRGRAGPPKVDRETPKIPAQQDVEWTEPDPKELEKDAAFLKSLGITSDDWDTTLGCTRVLYYDGIQVPEGWKLAQNEANEYVPIPCCIMKYAGQPLIYARFATLFEAFLPPEHGLREGDVEALRNKIRTKSNPHIESNVFKLKQFMRFTDNEKVEKNARQTMFYFRHISVLTEVVKEVRELQFKAINNPAKKRPRGGDDEREDSGHAAKKARLENLAHGEAKIKTIQLDEIVPVNPASQSTSPDEGIARTRLDQSSDELAAETFV
jgi:hypothetical protein